MGQKDKSRGGPRSPPQASAWPGGGWRRGVVWFTCAPLAFPFVLFIPSAVKTLKDRQLSQIRLRAPPPSETLIVGTKVSVLAPYWDGEVPSEL